MKKHIYILLFSLFLSGFLKAQSIKGMVTDEKYQPVDQASVSLLRKSDSSLIKMELTVNGHFHFDQLQSGVYYISVSHIGYLDARSAIISVDGTAQVITDLMLKKGVATLRSVAVVGRKSLVELKPDKTVLNIAGSVNSIGADALELLRKSPGVQVDKDDQLSLNGKNGVQVYIDNRPSPLRGQELAAYLKSLPSGQIERIELISNPPASFEASGSGGIINIRLKQQTASGWNGVVSGGWAIGARPRYDGGLSLNYRNQKISFYSQYNYAATTSLADFHLNRMVADTVFDQTARIRSENSMHAYKAGIDVAIDRKQSIGLSLHGNIADPEIYNRNRTPIYSFTTGNTKTILLSANDTRQHNRQDGLNLNYQYRDSSGQQLSVSGDYAYYSLESSQWQPNSFLDPTTGVVQSQRTYFIESPTVISIYTVKADYERPFAKGKLGIGLKSGFVRSDNEFRQYQVTTVGKEFDATNSSRFLYKENVQAGYLQYGRTGQQLAMQLGVRMELTNTEAAAVHRQYLDLFPNLALTFFPKSPNRFTLSYQRRIDRPVYKDLNPFEYRINEYTFHKGNTALRPQYSQTLSLSYQLLNRVQTSLSYSRVKDVFGQVVDTASGLKGYLSTRNLASQDNISLVFSYPFQYKRYSLFANMNTNYSLYRGDFGKGRTLQQEILSVSVFMQHSIRFNGGWAAELSGFYQSPSIWQGSLKTGSIWSADAGVQKQLFYGKATIKMSVTDLFRTLAWSANGKFAGQTTNVNGSQDSRQFKVGFTYRFGNASSKAGRAGSGSAEEETKRVQGSGGLLH
jgi:iron complex outermembrane receptor protein